MNVIGYLDTRGGVQKRILRPNWWLDDGTPVEDSVLIDQGVFPLYDQRPADTARFQYFATGYTVGETQAEVVWEQSERALEASKALTVEAINAIRDTRINDGFVHDGHTFQSAQSDRENIVRKGDRADKAISNGAVEGDLTWDDTTDGQPFVWITADNQLVPRDAFQMAALRDAGERFKQGCTFYARFLKDAVLAAADHDTLETVDLAANWPE